MSSRSFFQKNNRGMALVLTLLVVALLTAMVVEFAYGVYVSTSSLHNWQASQHLSVAARSGVKLASRMIASLRILYPGYTFPGVAEVSQKIPLDTVDGTITIRIEDENAKFNLNTLTGLPPQGQGKDYGYNALKTLLQQLELNPVIADRILYWLDPSTEHRPSGGKTAEKNSKQLDSIDELLLIPGIDAGSYDKLRPYVTIYSADKSININTATLPVLMSLPGMTKEQAEDIIEKRPYQARKNITGTGYESTAYHVIITAESGGIKRIIEAVLDVNGRTVKYWKEI